MELDRIIEEMNYMGASPIGKILSDEEISWFVNDLKAKKEQDIATYGKEELLKCFSLETITDLGQYGNEYYKLIENEKINEVINATLNEKAVIHSYNAIILDKAEKSDMVGHGFHRDMPWFRDTRTSVIVMIPLVDYGPFNGSTKYVPASHLMPNMPTLEYMEKHEVNVVGKAGEAFLVDSTTWHRAGDNQSGKSRPMIVLKYTLAPFKQQVEFYLSNPDLDKASDLVKARLGWNVRVPHSALENRDWDQATRKFKSGNYDMKNTNFR